MTFHVPNGWAIGAVTLAAVIACTPQPEQTGAATSPVVEEPSLTGPPAFVASASDLGFAGVWAASTADCAEPARTYLLTSETLHLTPQALNCAVKSLIEDHPTGRSTIYSISAVCIAVPPTGEAAGTQNAITLTFGASDMVMQMVVNNASALNLERCPIITP